MIDIAFIKVKAGNGGDGAVSFRREKFIARGGPDGGDGGNGGSVFFVADSNMSTLMDFRSRDSYKGQDGQGGGKKKMFGLFGEDLYIKVPLGTLLYEIKNGREILISDMAEPGIIFKVADGGIGGKGNFHFRSSTNQTPLQYLPGTPGEEKELKLEIKLVADIGLIGFPNAGKSTLINKLTNANAKVANYPFTTLEPNLGVFKMRNGETLVISDIPGLIEGASEGKGLGDEFLRHVERARILVHLVDPLDGFEEYLNTFDTEILTAEQKSNSPLQLGYVMGYFAFDKYQKIRGELDKYNPELSKKTEIVVLNKIDLTEVKENIEGIKAIFLEKGIDIVGISGVTGEGISILEEAILEVLKKNPRRNVFEAQRPVKLLNITNLPNRKIIFGAERVKIMADRKI